MISKHAGLFIFLLTWRVFRITCVQKRNSLCKENDIYGGKNYLDYERIQSKPLS